MIYHINKMKDKHNKIQHSFMVKQTNKQTKASQNKVGIEATYFNIIKAIYGKPTVNIMFRGKN